LYFDRRPLLQRKNDVKNFHIRNAGSSTHRTGTFWHTCAPTYVDVCRNIRALNCGGPFYACDNICCSCFWFLLLLARACALLLLISLSWHWVWQVSVVGVESAANFPLFWSLHTSILLTKRQNWKADKYSAK